ncbi:hypothetical protein H9185_001182 [Listeria monocytogenes]|nr:hypothetical protein [Listeria monocytogenes]
MELICKQKIIDDLKEFSTMLVAGGDPILAALMNRAIKSVEKQPSVDAVEVVHGRWKYYHKQNIAVCTNCSFERDLDANFGTAISCPNCGAKMDGERKIKDGQK